MSNKGLISQDYSPANMLVIAQELFGNLDVSETTRNDYRVRINHFLDHIRNTGFNYNSYLTFKNELKDRNDYGVATKNKYLITARVFLKELNRIGKLPVDITQGVKGFKQSHQHKRMGVTETEATNVFGYINSLPTGKDNDRMKALLSLLALQGLRQVEVTRLSVSDIDLTAKTLMVTGKGRDDSERIYLHPQTVEALQRYMKSNRIADGALFVSKSNNSVNQRITTRGIRLIIKDLLNKVGVDKTTHGFRHYFTTKLIQHYKSDLLEVARYTRHKSLEMLQVYNDSINHEADLPRFYETFSGVNLVAV